MMKGDGGSKARTQSTGSGMSVVLKKERDSLDRFLRLMWLTKPASTWS